MATLEAHKITALWQQDLQNNSIANQSDDPNYWSSDPSTLITTSNAVSFKLGTGFQILSSILPICAEAQNEIIIVTCFWAKSSSQAAISSLLKDLSEKAIYRGRKLQVRLCFSSVSIIQKLFQTGDLNGKIYPAQSWPGLGLPPQKDLGGLNLVVKSVFVRPFSVMHPKFILVDRKLAFLPSCNVSWENWFEGCVEMDGGIVEKLFDFWSSFWSRGGAELPAKSFETEQTISRNDKTRDALLNSVVFSQKPPSTTILLPSPHHVNPQFVPFHSPPPHTPLNLFLLQLFSQARRSIFIQTPNLTSTPVINALFSALERGVSIHLITSSKLMILEQLVTAGTITEIEVWKLRRKYNALLACYQSALNNDADPENLMEKPGTLRIEYYRAKEGALSENEPVKSHLKLVIMDEEITVLGSGNQDRASWYTSQELGVAFLDASIAKDIRRTVDGALTGRVTSVC